MLLPPEAIEPAQRHLVAVARLDGEAAVRADDDPRLHHPAADVVGVEDDLAPLEVQAAGSSLAACWGEVDHCASPFAALDVFPPAGELEGPPPEDATGAAAKPLALTSALRAGMAALTAAARARLLEQGAALARARVDAIVSNKNRGAYDRAARLWSAVHDAHVLAGRAEDGARLVAELRDRHSRHYRFRQRLDVAVRGSAAKLVR